MRTLSLSGSLDACTLNDQRDIVALCTIVIHYAIPNADLRGIV